ncbi:MAG: single-stranded DNA-binding protein, partial [Oscillibacter sp.]|nr:single-stranded DNA-binding protein [Oscillibacter sp.]
MLNRVSIMGHLVRDPELRRTQSGIAVTTMSIAVDRDFKSQDGTKQTDFFDVVAWRGTAEFASRYFFKGRVMVVDGRLQTRKWTDRDGNKRTSVEIIADSIYFGDSKRDNPNNNGDFNPGYGSQGGYGGYGNSQGGYGSAPGYGGSQSGGYGSYGNSQGGYGGYGNSGGYGGYGSQGGYGGYNSAPGYGGYDNSAAPTNPPPSTPEESGAQTPATETPSGSAD